MKVAILVLAVHGNIYDGLIDKGIRKTWGSVKIENVDIYYYYGDSIVNEVVDDIMNVNVPEGLMNIGKKTIEAFKLILNMKKYDYVFRTNASSYVNQKLMYDIAYLAPRTEFYSGVVGNYRGLKYASGSGYFISKDLMLYAIDHEYDLDSTYIDDVALGLLLKHVCIVPADRQDFTEQYQICKIPELYRRIHHYRCKYERDRSIDVMTMLKLHELTINKII